jgi:hypothetical protein
VVLEGVMDSMFKGRGNGGFSIEPEKKEEEKFVNDRVFVGMDLDDSCLFGACDCHFSPIPVGWKKKEE